MTDATILSSTDGAVATLTLHRPEALNALTTTMLRALESALRGVAADDTVSVIVLTGAGRAFSAGVDLKALAAAGVSDGDVSAELNDAARAVTGLLSTIPKVVIAKVNGFCFTGALELALACDLVVCADEAKLGDTHAKFGLRPTWGMSQRLIAMVGIARARELSYTARTFLGAEAATIGLASSSVPLAELDEHVAGLAASIAANSPGSIAAYKDLYAAALDRGLTGGLDYEASTSYRIADAGTRVAGFGS